MNFRNSLNYDKNGVLTIGGVSTDELIKTYGTPLYVFDYNNIESVAKAYNDAIKNEYDGYGKVFYASKAFSVKGMYKIANSLSLGCDVVSLGELYTALSSKMPAENIIMHGNNKSITELSACVSNNVKYVCLDSVYEAEVLDNLAKKEGKTVEVLIRVNPGIEAHTHHFVQTATPDSKFGFSLSDGSAYNFIKKVLTYKNLKLSGLHAHIGSQIFEAKSFLMSAEKLLDYYAKLKKELNLELPVLNLGGGFGIYYKEGDEKTTPKTYYDFISQIAAFVKEKVQKEGLNKPFLIFEPGRSIVGEAGITLYTVGQIKEIKGLKKYLPVDGGMFDNPRYALYGAKYTVVPVKKSDEKVEKFTVCGKCCESGDIITEDAYLPPLKAGENIAVLSTGAYNYSMASHYNRNTVPPCAICRDGKFGLLVKKEDLEDLTRNDVIPDFI